jgi:lysophospholipid acyltransferase (LPLAT)-like uncharacterized protein
VNPTTERILLSVVPRLAWLYIRLLRRTLRTRYERSEVLDACRRDPGQYILAFWHSRFLMMPFAYPDRRITILSSRHRDSEMLARVLVRFGYALSKGSSTEGGAAGLRDVIRKVRDGYDVAFTPDGPRGPRRRAKPGVIAAARLTGLPVVPVAFSAVPASRLRTWDRTLVPRPFGRGLYLYGTPLRVPRDAAEAEQERLRLSLETELDRVTDEADRAVGIEPEDPRPPVGGA